MTNKTKRSRKSEKKTSSPVLGNKAAEALLSNSFSDFSGVLEIKILFTKGLQQLVSCVFRKNASLGRGKKGTPSSDQLVPPLAENKISGDSEQFFIKENKVLQKLSLQEILFIKAMGDYVCIYTPERKITIHTNLKSLEKKLPVNRFIRIHRSYMVSINKIDVIEEGTIYISSNPIPIGEAYRTKLMRFLNIIK